MTDTALTIVRTTKARGRGVFATERIKRGSIVIRDPVLVFRNADASEHGAIYDFAYFWERGKSAIALGHGSLLNHSRWPNLVWRLDEKNQQIVFKARWTIDRGEELTINYGRTLGFVPREQ